MRLFVKKFYILFLFASLSSSYVNASERESDSSKVIIDCNYSFEESTSGVKIPDELKKNLELISVQYFSLDGKIHQGQILIHKDLAKDVIDIFKIIKESKFPIAKTIPIVKYNWNDEKSMQDNNTSAFNYRNVARTKILSAHSTGRAIDINPKLNPQIKRNNSFPRGSKYEPDKKGTISAGSLIVKEFIRRGWKWGGYWKSTKDYQHFEKKIKKR